MNIIIHPAFLPDDGPDACLASSRRPGFEVRKDAGYGGLIRMTAGPPGQSGRSISGLHVRP